ncbi:MAG: hypothetical protein NXI31_20335 [bacterium]|nr:hypothetical protein [bacterium]
MRCLGDAHAAVLDSGVRSLGRLLLGVVAARCAGADGYAVFVMLVAIEVVSTSFANALFAMPLLTIAPGLEEGERAAASQWTQRRVVRAGTLVALGGVAIAFPVTGFLDIGALTVVAFGCAVGASIVADGMRAVRQAYFEAQRTVFADGVAALVPLLTVLWLAPVGDAAITWLFFGVSAGQAAAAMRMHRASTTNVPARSTRDALRELARPFAAGSAITSVTSRTQPLILGLVASTAEIALFGAAVALVGPMRLVTGALSGVLRPRLSRAVGRGGLGDPATTLGRGIALQLGFGCCVLVAVTVAGEQLSEFVFGAGFAGVGGALPLAALFAVLEGLGAIGTVAVQTMVPGGASRATFARFMAGSCGLLGMWLVAGRAGAVGALAVMVAVELLFLSLVTTGARQRANRPRSIP